MGNRARSDIESAALIGAASTFILGLVYQTVSIATAVYLHLGLDIALALAGGTLMLIFVSMRWGGGMVASAILAIAAALRGSAFLSEYEATKFSFADGLPLLDYIGEQRDESRSQGDGIGKELVIDYRCVVPFAVPGSSDPVTAWLVCGNGENHCRSPRPSPCLRSWLEADWRAGLQAVNTNVERAIADAENSHGLRSHPAARVLTYTDDPMREQTERKAMSEDILLWLNTLNLTYLIGFLVYTATHKPTRRRY